MYMYMYMYMYIHIYIHTYIYIQLALHTTVLLEMNVDNLMSTLLGMKFSK